MTDKGFSHYQREDNIAVFEILNTERETVLAWKALVEAQMDNVVQPSKRLYDLRQAKSFSLHAMRTIFSVRTHPNTRFFYTAVITTNERVAEMVNTMLNIMPGGSFQIFTDKETAVAWLNQQVPDTP